MKSNHDGKNPVVSNGISLTIDEENNWKHSVIDTLVQNQDHGPDKLCVSLLSRSLPWNYNSLYIGISQRIEVYFSIVSCNLEVSCNLDHESKSFGMTIQFFYV